jgi:hypothetical protein
MTVVLGATREALRFDLETVPTEQFPQRNVAHVIGQRAVGLVICSPLALIHECQYQRKECVSCPQLGANFEAKASRLPKIAQSYSVIFCCAH